MTFNKSYIAFRRQRTIHRQIATATFLLFLLYPSTIILANVTMATIMAAKLKEPICLVNIHLYDVEIGLPYKL